MTKIRRGKYGIFRIAIILMVTVFPCFANGESPAISNGLNWLSNNQNPDGSWGNMTELTVQDTTAVLDTFKYLNMSTSAYSNGVLWLTVQFRCLKDLLSRKMITLSAAGIDVSVDISAIISNRNIENEWGERQISQR